MEADLGVAVYSTIVFERLFFGYKTLLFPYGMEGFPIEGSSFGNICPNTPDKLYDALGKNLPLTRESFFEINNLKDYTWKSYPSFVVENSSAPS